MDELTKKLNRLKPEAIAALQPGTYGDYELLDPYGYFYENGDQKRLLAVAQLILRSPEHSEMVNYEEIYEDTINQFYRANEGHQALAWAYAAFTYGEQHFGVEEHIYRYQQIANTYLDTGAFAKGLALYTRLLQVNPRNLWLYHGLGIILPVEGLRSLALEVLARGLEIAEQDGDPADLADQFLANQKEIKENGKANDGRLAEIDASVLADLRAAMQLPDGIGEDGYPPLIAQLLTAPLADTTLYPELLHPDAAYAADLIRLAFDKTHRNTPAARHAVALLRQMQAEKTAELDELSRWLDQADGDWQTLLSKDLGKIGGYTIAETKTIISDTNNQLYTRTAAVQSLAERIKKGILSLDECISFFRTLLTRPEAGESAAEETFIGFLIGDLLDLEARELLDEILAAFHEDRINPEIIGIESIYEEWDLPSRPVSNPRKDGMYLGLICGNCQRQRTHFVQQVTVDLPTLKKEEQKGKHSPFIMDREIECPKCGAKDHYTLSPQAQLRLMSPDTKGGIFNFLRGKKSKRNPRLHPIQASVFGTIMHPLVGLERYRQLIAAQPKNAELQVRMSNLLRSIYRYEDALQAARKAYSLDGNDIDIVLALAMAEHDFGDKTAAKSLYEQAQQQAAGQSLQEAEMLEAAAIAREGLKLLKRKKDSPFKRERIAARSSAPKARRRRRKRKKKKRKRRR